MIQRTLKGDSFESRKRGRPKKVRENNEKEEVSPDDEWYWTERIEENAHLDSKLYDNVRSPEEFEEIATAHFLTGDTNNYDGFWDKVRDSPHMDGFIMDKIQSPKLSRAKQKHREIIIFEGGDSVITWKSRVFEEGKSYAYKQKVSKHQSVFRDLITGRFIKKPSQN